MHAVFEQILESSDILLNVLLKNFFSCTKFKIHFLMRSLMIITFLLRSYPSSSSALFKPSLCCPFYKSFSSTQPFHRFFSIPQKRYFSSFNHPHDQFPRSRQTLMFGIHTSDEKYLSNDPTITNIRKMLDTAIQQRDFTAFFDQVHKAIQFMQTLPSHHAFYWPMKFGFWKHPAPSAYILEASMHRIFDKIIGEPHNGSGVAVEGACGVGKTHLLRVVVMLCGILVPHRVIAAYVDYKMVPASSACPSRIICAALQAAGCNNASIIDEDTTTIDDALGRAALSNRVIVFAADEISHVYLNDRIWSELHGLATDIGSVMFVTDSGSKLRADDTTFGAKRTVRSISKTQI